MTTYINGTSAVALEENKVIPFLVEEKQPAKKKGNYKTGEKQEVYPFKTKEDLQKMHEYFVKNREWRNDFMFIFGVNVGLRAGDLLKLTWGQIFPESYDRVTDTIVVKEEKTEKWRTFFLNDSCKRAAKEYLKRYITTNRKFPPKDEYTFLSQKEGHLSVRAAGKILKTTAESVGIKFNVGTHSMRKTFGYWQLKAHQDDAMFLCELQEMFNHTSPKITLRYCGLESEKMSQYYNDVCLL